MTVPLPDGTRFALLGGLAALPRRLAVRAVAAQGGRLGHGITRATTHVVLGRSLLRRGDAASLAALGSNGRVLLGERGFLRLLGLVPPAAPGGLDRAEMLAKSGLDPDTLDRLALFDAFAADAAPFALHDLILARKYAGLIAGGAGWGDILRAVHRLGPAVSLTAKSLQVGDGGAILAREGDRLLELDGQARLPFDAPESDADEIFAEAEAAEAAGALDDAIALYGRCLHLDPTDAVAAFNRANCLAAAGRVREAEAEHLRALKIDPGLTEARYNLAGLLAAGGRSAAARAHLTAALATDPDYPDAIYNLALLEFEAGDGPAAAALWRRYLALDPESDWAATATRGLQLLALQSGGRG